MKKTGILAVSLIAIMTAGAARADLASTGYVQGAIKTEVTDAKVKSTEQLTDELIASDVRFPTMATAQNLVLNATSELSTDKQDKADSTAVKGTYIEAGNAVGSNLKKLDDAIVSNDADIAAIKTEQTKQNTDITNLQNSKLDAANATVAAGTYEHITAGSNVNTNLVSLNEAIEANDADIAKLKDGTALGEGAVKEANLAADAVTTTKIKDGAVTTAKIADKNVTEGKLDDALAKKINDKLDTSKATVAAGTYKHITAGSDVNTNLVSLNAAVEANDADIADIKTEQGTQNTNITNLQTNKLDAANADVAADANYIKKGTDVKANLGFLDTQVKTNTDAISGLQAGTGLAAGAVTTDKIADKSVTEDKLDTELATKINGKQDAADSKVATAGSYIAAGNAVGANLTALDKQVKNNTDNISKTVGATKPAECATKQCVLINTGDTYKWEVVADTYTASAN